MFERSPLGPEDGLHLICPVTIEEAFSRINGKNGTTHSISLRDL